MQGRHSFAHCSASRGRLRFPRLLAAECRLMGLDQVADTLGVGFAVAVARNGVGATSGLDANVGPDHTGGDMHGGDFRNGDALFIAAEQTRLHAADPLRADYKSGWEEEVALRKATGLEGLGLPAGCGSAWRFHCVIVRRRNAALGKQKLSVEALFHVDSRSLSMRQAFSCRIRRLPSAASYP